MEHLLHRCSRCRLWFESLSPTTRCVACDDALDGAPLPASPSVATQLRQARAVPYEVHDREPTEPMQRALPTRASRG